MQQGKDLYETLFRTLPTFALCLALAACGTPGNNTAESTATGAQSTAPLHWYTEPTLTLDDMVCMVDDAPWYSGFTEADYRGLAFYEENGRLGVIGPGTEYEKLLVIPYERLFTAYAKQQVTDWLFVAYEADSGRCYGWVSAEYARICE